LPLLAEGLVVVFDLLGPDVVAGREDVAVPGDLVRGGRLAEAGNVLTHLPAGPSRGSRRKVDGAITPDTQYGVV